MQDKYVGDIGDFGKYGLLRFIFMGNKLKLGIHWCLVSDEKHNSDGRHIDYLFMKNEKDKRRKCDVYKNCDPELYNELFKIVKPKLEGSTVISTGARSVRRIEKSHIIPAVSYYDGKDRLRWLEDGLDKLKDCDVIFLDPDNGLASDSMKNKRNHPKSCKYIYGDEINKFYASRKSLILYHHKDRTKEHAFLGRFSGLKPDLILRWNRVGVRYYLFKLQEKHKDAIMSRIDRLKNSEWFLGPENWSKKWYKKSNFEEVKGG